MKPVEEPSVTSRTFLSNKVSEFSSCILIEDIESYNATVVYNYVLYTQ